MRSPFTLLALLAVGGVPFTTIVARDATDRGPDEVVVKAMDYAFDLPATVRPGKRVIRLINAGTEAHHLYLVKLAEGKKLEDFLGAMAKEHGGWPAWARQVGGPNAPVPGGESVAIVDLDPGSYVAMCVIPAADGKPHLMKGMVRAFTVEGAMMPDPRLEPTVSAVLTDYAFSFASPVGAGRQIIEFVNRAGQPHEAFLARLLPGRKPEDLLTWLGKPDGPPPVVPMGGITGIEPGARQSIVVDLEPGNYVWYCFVPDAKDGREHVAHGMVRPFTISEPRRAASVARAKGR